MASSKSNDQIDGDRQIAGDEQQAKGYPLADILERSDQGDPEDIQVASKP